jgi:hypothetical protein
MKLSVIKQSLLALFFISVLISCEYEFIEIAGPKPPDPNDTTNPVDTVSFAAEVVPIFSASSCTNCHNGGLALDLSAGNAYSSIMSNGMAIPEDPENSKIYYYPHPVTGTHGTKYQNTDQSDLIYLWIFQGALDN